LGAHDARVRDKINSLIEDIQRHPFSGLGKPEPLKRNLKGFWSRRINREHRLFIVSMRVRYKSHSAVFTIDKKVAGSARRVF
jgi:Txe/YoeB family toxin of toxin-antitoxin system